MLRDSTATLCSAALLAIAVSGTAGAEAVDPQVGAIGPLRWMETLSPAFAAEDAYVFADFAGPARLEADAFALAVERDLDRLAHPAPPAQPAGRVAAAFARFSSYGEAAYAPRASTPGARAAIVAEGPAFSPARLAMLTPPR